MKRIPFALKVTSGSLVGALVGASILLACSDDDTTPTPTPDAGPDVVEASVPDAAADAAKEAAPDANTPTWCSARPNESNIIACEDFDKTGDLTSRGWANDPTPGNVAPTIVADLRRSDPNAMHSSVAAGASGDRASRYTRTGTVTDTTKKWTYEADVIVTQWQGPGGAPADSVLIHSFGLSTAGDAKVEILLKGGASAICTFVGDGTTTEGPAPLAFAPSQWHHLKLIVEKKVDVYDLTCDIDGTTSVITGKAATVTADRVLPVGALAHGAQGLFEAVYDNMLFRAE